MAWSWDFTVQVFRSLGGSVQNITRKDGPGAKSLIAVDPEKTIGLHAPENLIFAVSDIEFLGGRLRIRDASQVAKAERTFFENYYEDFSWSSSERDEAAAFLKGHDELPADVRAILSDEFGVSLGEEDAGDRVERWLLQRRLLGWRGGPVLVPFFDLVQHNAKAQPYGQMNGISLAGRFPGEVQMLRSRLSPFAAFWIFGSAIPERAAFSLPMTLQLEDGGAVEIDQAINMNSVLGSTPVPDFECDGKSVRFSCLMLGSSRNPRLSRGIFYRIMRDAGKTTPEEVFDHILHLNRMSYLKLMEVLEPHQGGLIPALRKVVRYQLEAMSWCVGAREL